jgi:uncharacterized protein YceK
MKKLIVLMLTIITLSSCQTVKEITMSNNKKTTQCAWFE